MRITIFFLKTLNVLFARRNGGIRGSRGCFRVYASLGGGYGKARKYVATATAKKGPTATAKIVTRIPWGVVAEATGIQRVAPPFV